MSDIVTTKKKFKKGWTGGLPETPCGFGSKMSSTKRQREWLPAMVAKYNIRSIADIGAGDLNWVPSIDWDVEYSAYDLVPRSPEVVEFDLVREVPPKVDAILCLWVLNHMPYDDCLAALENLRASGAKYLFMTDRPKWHHEQPPQIKMQAHEAILLNDKGDKIKFIKL
ncbi:MAG: hypothetical protein DRH08_03025 [Deltaproteobacteria bacterium]|nr:MAG: hypothetical protein DRH08_03025 [Deltaproteobacteria bacterium]